jgi:hypothetical protein
MAQLDDRHDVQDSIDAPIAGTRQAMALVVAGRRLDRCGAVPGREVRGGAEPADVADVAQQAGCSGWADPVEFAQRAASRGDEFVEVLVRGPDLASMTVSSSMSSRASWWRVWATMPAGAGVSQVIAAWPPLALLVTVELIARVPVHRPWLAVVRWSATAVIAGIAAWVSYWHMAGVAARYGETGATPYLLPFSVDGLVVVAPISLVELSGRIRALTDPATRPAVAEHDDQADAHSRRPRIPAALVPIRTGTFTRLNGAGPFSLIGSPRSWIPPTTFWSWSSRTADCASVRRCRCAAGISTSLAKR